MTAPLATFGSISPLGENSTLLHQSQKKGRDEYGGAECRRGRVSRLLICLVGGACIVAVGLFTLGFVASSSKRIGWWHDRNENGTVKKDMMIVTSASLRKRPDIDMESPILGGGGSEMHPLLGKNYIKEYVKKKKKHGTSTDKAQPATDKVKKRCDWVVNLFTEKYAGNSEDELRTQYAIQATDANVFYRATANIFWMDYVKGGWGELLQFENIGIKAVHSDGTPLSPKSTWTWVTGDQHLSNFGAWRNRNHDIVFGVNDFDEAAIYDFQVDILRIAVSVCSHAYTNGLSTKNVNDALRAFTDAYVMTLLNYVGSDKELIFELTPETSSGVLKVALEGVRDDKSPLKQLDKFTEMNKDGEHRFIRDENTRLVSVSPDVEKEIREQFTETNYGATMMKMGYHIHGWDDRYFEILDIAARVGSGVGSYGVPRYYILIEGEEDDKYGGDANDVILDCKYEPPGAVSQVLTSEDAAWYSVMFPNDAARAIQAQRKLTSYIDPFTGWVYLDGGKPFVVRERSPWKSSPNYDNLNEPNDFIDFMEQVAVSTATSHARGTVSKSPAQFKHVISGVLKHWLDRKVWGTVVSEVAHAYREQVLLDFQCFKDYVEENYS